MKMEKEFVEMMNRCRSEILVQRQQISSLQPKADAYDNITAILRLLPRGGEGYSVDLVRILDERIKELTALSSNETPAP
jgi:hypothetical protein